MHAEDSLEADMVIFGSIMSACQHSQNLDLVKNLLLRMQIGRLNPNLMVANAAINCHLAYSWLMSGGTLFLAFSHKLIVGRQYQLSVSEEGDLSKTFFCLHRSIAQNYHRHIIGHSAYSGPKFMCFSEGTILCQEALIHWSPHSNQNSENRNFHFTLDFGLVLIHSHDTIDYSQQKYLGFCLGGRGINFIAIT